MSRTLRLIIFLKEKHIQFTIIYQHALIFSYHCYSIAWPLIPSLSSVNWNLFYTFNIHNNTLFTFLYFLVHLRVLNFWLFYLLLFWSNVLCSWSCEVEHKSIFVPMVWSWLARIWTHLKSKLVNCYTTYSVVVSGNFSKCSTYFVKLIAIWPCCWSPTLIKALLFL